MTRACLWTPVVVAAVSLLCLLTQSAAADGAWVLWFAQGSLSTHGVGYEAQDLEAIATFKTRASARPLWRHIAIRLPGGS